MSHHPDLPDDHYRPTYEDIHNEIAKTALQIREKFRPDLIVAIGGGGFFPARVLRTFLKRNIGDKLVNVPIQAIGLSLYEDVAASETRGPSAKGTIGLEVVRTQWLDAPKKAGEDHLLGSLLGKNILIVDEVDDSRTTLQYAYNELLSDVKASLYSLSIEQKASLPPTRFAIFVVHNKLRNKKGSLPILWSNHSRRASQPAGEETPLLTRGQENVGSRQDKGGEVVEGLWYFAAETTRDIWVEYPWEQDNIEEHNRLAALSKQLGENQR